MTASKVSHSPDPHPSDGVLLALHDGESGGTLDAERAHVDQCADCQARLAAIQNNSASVRQAPAPSVVSPRDRNSIRRQPKAAPPARVIPLWRRRAIMAASTLIVATAMTAAAGPLRRWIAQRMSLARTTPAAAVRPSNTTVESQRPVSGPTLSFAVAGSELVVRLDSMPGAGALTIEPAKTDKISARVSAGFGTGGDTMVVLPGELRMRNTTASRASYALALPTEVVRLRVIVAGRVLFHGSPPTESEADPRLTETPLRARPYRPRATKLREIALEHRLPATFASPSAVRANAPGLLSSRCSRSRSASGRIPRCSASSTPFCFAARPFRIPNRSPRSTNTRIEFSYAPFSYQDYVDFRRATTATFSANVDLDVHARGARYGRPRRVAHRRAGQRRLLSAPRASGGGRSSAWAGRRRRAPAHIRSSFCHTTIGSGRTAPIRKSLGKPCGSRAGSTPSSA